MISKAILILLLSLVTGLNVSAHATNAVSAVRAPNENYLDAAQNYFSKRSLGERVSIQDDAFGVRSLDVNPANVAQWTHGDIKKVFLEIRDERFMSDESGFARRPTWLYPYDGCYARAEIAAQRLESKGYTAPSKIFIFGNLNVKTENAYSGSVSWWYHVAVAYQYNNEVYIFDPALEPSKMLDIKVWSKMMGESQKEFSICKDSTYSPDSSCGHSQKMSYSDAESEQASFFDREKTNLESLDRNPDEELGDHAPWEAKNNQNIANDFSILR